MANYSLVQRGVTTVTVGDVSPKDVALASPVKPGSAEVKALIRESRIPALPDPDLTLEHRGATVRLLNANTIRIEWNGTLSTDAEAGDETITVAWQVFDIDDLGDDIKEILFRQLRLLGYAGEAKIQDLCVYDTPGNLVSYRVRVFDTKAHADAATVDLDDAQNLQTGELARYNVTVALEKDENDRVSLKMVRTKLAANPDIS